MVNQTFADVGLTPVPSVTNFVFADIGRDADDYPPAMAEEGVLINAVMRGIRITCVLAWASLKTCKHLIASSNALWRAA